jgi:hypothetical protein
MYDSLEDLEEKEIGSAYNFAAWQREIIQENDTLSA